MELHDLEKCILKIPRNQEVMLYLQLLIESRIIAT